MSDTSNLSLPLLVAAQAQKHVTVNETIQMLDHLVQLSVVSRSLAAPPSNPDDGDRYIVASGGNGAWDGQDDKVAAWQDGVWVFHLPRQGWKVFVVNEGLTLTFASGRWRSGVALHTSGAGTSMAVVSETHTLASAAVSDTSMLIPERAVLLGVTCLVTTAVLGPSTFSVGVDGDPQRFGNGIGTGLNAQLNAPLTPAAYYAGTPIRLSADGASFAGGVVQVSAHILKLQIPDFV